MKKQKTPEEKEAEKLVAEYLRICERAKVEPTEKGLRAYLAVIKT